MIYTYRALCAYANFDERPALSNTAENSLPQASGNGLVVMDGGDVTTAPAAPQKMSSVSKITADGIPVTINIQLTLPESNDPKVYENIFKAMKDCFLS